MRGLSLVCLVVLPGCIFLSGGGFGFGFAPQPPTVWSPTPPRPPGVYHPLPVAIPLGRPPDRFLPVAPAPEPEYVPLTVPTEVSVWLDGHWRWEDRFYGDGVGWTAAPGWVWAEGRWIDKPCPELDLAQAEHQRSATGVRYLEPHWRCGAASSVCACPGADKPRLAQKKL